MIQTHKHQYSSDDEGIGDVGTNEILPIILNIIGQIHMNISTEAMMRCGSQLNTL